MEGGGEAVRDRILDELRHAFAEHERRDDERFDVLRNGQAEVMRLLRDVTETVDELEREVGGAPKVELRGADRPTLRDRVHYLESSAEAARIAQQALAQVRTANANAWTRREKALAGAFAFVAALTSVLRLIGVGG